MENESSIGQPIPTAVLTPTEIIAPPDSSSDNPTAEAPPAEPLSAAVSPSTNIVAEMMFAPIAFWASFSTSYFRLFGMMGSATPSWQRTN